MIRYSLLCEHDHGFEAWFGSSADFDDQAPRGLIECPLCASKRVRKAIMAPAIQGTKNKPAAPDEAARLQTVMMEAAKQVRAHVEQNFDYVGDSFAREARAIHEGDSDSRGIYGEATPKEVAELTADGIGVAPLPPAATPIPKAKIN